MAVSTLARKKEIKRCVNATKTTNSTKTTRTATKVRIVIVILKIQIEAYRKIPIKVSLII